MQISRLVLASLFMLVCPGQLLLAADNPDLAISVIPDQSAQIQVLVAQADEYIVQNEYEQAITLLSQAWQLTGFSEDSAVGRNVLNSLASLYYHTGQLDAASRYFKELVALDETNGDLQGLSVSLFNLGHAAASQQDFRAADVYFKRSLDIGRQLDDKSGTAFTQKAMGVNAQAMGNLVTAEDLLQSALKIFTAINDEQQAATVLRHLGDIKLEQNSPQAAVDYYLQAVPTLARTAFNSALLRTYRGLSLAYEQMGNIGKALIAQRAYSELMQFELEQQGQQTTQRMQVQFETQRFADDNARLQALRIQQELQLAASKQLVKLQYLALALGCGLLFLVLFMLYRSRLTARRMHKLAITDELTKLFNRRAIMAKGKEEWQRAARFHHPFSCLMFDVDNFKSINDTLGHAIGDEVLKAIAKILEKLLRKTDYVGRIGGEEFLLLAPETDRLQAITLAERIRIGIQNAEIPGIIDRKITVSIGIAGLHRETSIEQMIQHADQALYAAKESGRNRSILYQECKEQASSESARQAAVKLQPALQYSSM